MSGLTRNRDLAIPGAVSVYELGQFFRPVSRARQWLLGQGSEAPSHTQTKREAHGLSGTQHGTHQIIAQANPHDQKRCGPENDSRPIVIQAELQLSGAECICHKGDWLHISAIFGFIHYQDPPPAWTPFRLF